MTKAHRDKVASYLDSGVADGATLVVDGREGDVDADGEGYFLRPTLFDHVTPEMSVYTDEIFGPVLSVVRAKSYDEGLELINANPYGNGTAIFTNDGGAARRFQSEVEVGMVGINVPIPVPMAYYSFGGWKNSLFGDTHAHGMEGVHFFTRGKVATAASSSASPRTPEPQGPSPFPTHTSHHGPGILTDVGAVAIWVWSTTRPTRYGDDTDDTGTATWRPTTSSATSTESRR